MKANAMPLLGIFENKQRLEIPMFQRQYVWNREQQWEPLWEDIARKFTEQLEGREDAPVHFLGAMVLDQKQTPTGHVPKRQVIDGQQRLTTLQIFLAAFRDLCRTEGVEELASECDGYTLNKGMMADPAVDRFKVWPTQLDRAQFADIMTLGSREAIEQKHPIIFQKYARKPDPRPRMVEAYVFFFSSIRSFFVGSPSEPPPYSDRPLAERLETCFQSLRAAVQVVIIDLDPGDDAQVIFETLNARGEPLLPADLLRNFIFLRAARSREDPESLYAEHWSRFDDQFWRHEVKQGRLVRPRSDLFIQHYLSSERAADIPIKHLYVEYKGWIEKERPFPSVEAELVSFASQGDTFRRFLAPTSGDVVAPLAKFLDKFEISPAYPLLLAFARGTPDDQAWRDLSTVLESYLLRRAVCGLTSQAYNKVFLAVLRAMNKGRLIPQAVNDYLMNSRGESVEWPTDAAFHAAWMESHAYQNLNNPKLIHILSRLNSTFMTAKAEDVVVNGPLTVEHILPQAWVPNWPLPDGGAGLTPLELHTMPDDDPRVEPSRKRHAVLQTIGNLTILTQPLNSAVSNSAWKHKKAEILGTSLLPINQQTLRARATDEGGPTVLDDWNEDRIRLRGIELFARALALWPHGIGV